DCRFQSVSRFSASFACSAPTLTQRHGRLIGAVSRRVESVWPGQTHWGFGIVGATGEPAFASPPNCENAGTAIAVARQGFRNSFGSLAIFAAIRRASSLVSNLARDRNWFI